VPGHTFIRGGCNRARAARLTTAVVMALALGACAEEDEGAGEREATSAREVTSEPDPTTEAAETTTEAEPTETAEGEPVRERVVLADKAGDAEDGNYKRYPARRDLDLRRMVVERLGEDLRITWKLAGAPTKPSIFTFSYYDEAGNSGAYVEVHDRDGELVVWANPSLEDPVNELSGAATLRGSTLIVTVPGENVLYLPSFRWSATVGTYGIANQIIDGAPDPGDDLLNPKTARFP
jgi:hypothetical protein